MQKDDFKEAVIEACIVNYIDWYENDARRTLNNLIAYEVKLALNPPGKV